MTKTPPTVLVADLTKRKNAAPGAPKARPPVAGSGAKGQQARGVKGD